MKHEIDDREQRRFVYARDGQALLDAGATAATFCWGICKRGFIFQLRVRLSDAGSTSLNCASYRDYNFILHAPQLRVSLSFRSNR